MFLDGMNGIYLYFVNNIVLVGRYWDFKELFDMITNCISYFSGALVRSSYKEDSTIPRFLTTSWSMR